MPRQPLGGEDRTENAQVGNAHSKVDSAHSNAQAFVSDKTVGTSQTQTGANTWMSSFISDVNTHLGNIESTKAHNLTVRESMHTQAERFGYCREPSRPSAQTQFRRWKSRKVRDFGRIP